MTGWKPNVVQVAGSLFLIALLVLFSHDLISAVSAQPCPGSDGCYPWGAEGPAAGRWSYDSKTNYLVRGFAQIGLLAGSGLFLILRLSGDYAFSASVKLSLVAALGLWLVLFFV
jgi:hypothetical protein